MGEYFRVVNVDRMEYLVPLDGLKLGEFYHSESETLRIVQGLLNSGRWSLGDEIRLIGDDDSEFHARGIPTLRAVRYDSERLSKVSGIQESWLSNSLDLGLFPKVPDTLLGYYGADDDEVIDEKRAYAEWAQKKAEK